MDDKSGRNGNGNDEPLWLVVANTVQSLVLVLTFLLLLPWRSYYAHTLLWSDAQGMGVFFGVLSVLNAISLVIRARAVEVMNIAWSKIEDRNVAMVASYLANTLVWGGLAIWCVYKELGLDRMLCYFVTATGAFGHTALYAARWNITKSKSDGFITTAYGILSVVVTLTFLSGDDWM